MHLSVVYGGGISVSFCIYLIMHSILPNSSMSVNPVSDLSHVFYIQDIESGSGTRENIGKFVSSFISVRQMECYGTSVVFRGIKQIWKRLEGYCCGCMFCFLLSSRFPLEVLFKFEHMLKNFSKRHLLYILVLVFSIVKYKSTCSSSAYKET